MIEVYKYINSLTFQSMNNVFNIAIKYVFN